jgi:hypothetical protein
LPQPGVTPEEQRRLQEIEAAHLSKLFTATAIRVAAPPVPASASAAPGAISVGAAARRHSLTISEHFIDGEIGLTQSQNLDFRTFM